jgi:hypothetical protein
MKQRQALVIGGTALGVSVVALIGFLVSQRSQLLVEEKGMREIRHNTLSYRGRAGEPVSIRVETQGDTNHMVHYVLDGSLPARVLPAGQKITFNLKNNSGAQTILQVDLDFTAEGSYKVIVENVIDCSRDTANVNECVRTVEGFADGQTLNFQFFVE